MNRGEMTLDWLTDEFEAASQKNRRLELQEFLQQVCPCFFNLTNWLTAKRAWLLKPYVGQRPYVKVCRKELWNHCLRINGLDCPVARNARDSLVRNLGIWQSFDCRSVKAARPSRRLKVFGWVVSSPDAGVGEHSPEKFTDCAIFPSRRIPTRCFPSQRRAGCHGFRSMPFVHSIAGTVAIRHWH